MLTRFCFKQCFSLASRRMFSSLSSIPLKHEAYEVIGYDDNNIENHHKTLLLTCEHASNHIPLTPSLNDIKILNTHWGIDIGAEEMTRELINTKFLSGNEIGLLSHISRLYCDMNRPITSNNIFRSECDSIQIDLNVNVNTEIGRNIEGKQRIDDYWIPYHNIAGSIVKSESSTLELILAIHSFTNNYQGEIRDLEIGVLHDGNHINQKHAEDLCNYLKNHSYDARINEPWSGLDGYLFSPLNAASNSNIREIPVLMLEFRNDLLSNNQWRSELIPILLTGLTNQFPKLRLGIT